MTPASFQVEEAREMTVGHVGARRADVQAQDLLGDERLELRREFFAEEGDGDGVAREEYPTVTVAVGHEGGRFPELDADDLYGYAGITDCTSGEVMRPIVSESIWRLNLRVVWTDNQPSPVVIHHENRSARDACQVVSTGCAARHALAERRTEVDADRRPMTSGTRALKAERRSCVTARSVGRNHPLSFQAEPTARIIGQLGDHRSRPLGEAKQVGRESEIDVEGPDVVEEDFFHHHLIAQESLSRTGRQGLGAMASSLECVRQQRGTGEDEQTLFARQRRGFQIPIYSPLAQDLHRAHRNKTSLWKIKGRRMPLYHHRVDPESTKADRHTQPYRPSTHDQDPGRLLRPSRYSHTRSIADRSTRSG